MTSQQSLGGSCSPTPPSPNPPATLASIASIQQEIEPNSSSDSSIEQRNHAVVVMGGSLTPSIFTRIFSASISPGTFTPSPISSAMGTGAGSSGSATTAMTGTNGMTTTYTANGNNQRRLSFDERIQVIQLRSNGKSLRKLAHLFGCHMTQILNILGQREAYLKEYRRQAELPNLHIEE